MISCKAASRDITTLSPRGGASTSMSRRSHCNGIALDSVRASPASAAASPGAAPSPLSGSRLAAHGTNEPAIAPQEHLRRSELMPGWRCCTSQAHKASRISEAPHQIHGTAVVARSAPEGSLPVRRARLTLRQPSPVSMRTRLCGRSRTRGLTSLKTDIGDSLSASKARSGLDFPWFSSASPRLRVGFTLPPWFWLMTRSA
jgi:hypothetical protein